MIIEIEFDKDKDSIEDIIKENSDLYLLETKYLHNGNFLIFSDVPTVEIIQQKQGDKISILHDGLKAILAGDMQELAYLLYPNDFKNKIETILEL